MSYRIGSHCLGISSQLTEYFQAMWPVHVSASTDVYLSAASCTSGGLCTYSTKTQAGVAQITNGTMQLMSCTMTTYDDVGVYGGISASLNLSSTPNGLPVEFKTNSLPSSIPVKPDTGLYPNGWPVDLHASSLVSPLSVTTGSGTGAPSEYEAAFVQAFQMPETAQMQTAFMLGFSIPMICYLTAWAFGLLQNWFDHHDRH